jgi:hypothetical protein
MASEGLLLQMDGSQHKWNGKDEWCLIGLIDDATSEMPAARFFPGETTFGCMAVLRAVIEAKGVPQMIYTDCAGWAGGSTKRAQFSHFTRACEELGIRVLTTSSPQSKGRIERAWRTMQDRLIPELRVAGITNMLDANRYLDQVFLPKYWQERNTIAARDGSRYRELAAHENLDEIFCLKSRRRVRNDQTVSYEGRLYRLPDRQYGTLSGKEVVIHEYADQALGFFYGHIRLRHELIPLARRFWEKRGA